MKKTMIFIKFVVFILLIVSNIVVETVLVLDEYQQGSYSLKNLNSKRFVRLVNSISLHFNIKFFL